MPSATRTGSSLPQLQRQTFRSDPSRGETVISDYRGANQSAVIGNANIYGAAGIAYDLTLAGGLADLNANDATANNPIDNWEIVGNAERRDLFQNPLWANDLTDDQLAAVRFYLNSDTSPANAFLDTSGTPVKDSNGNTVANLHSLIGTVVQRAYARYQMGNDEFEHDAYGAGSVLRHTTNVPARWGVNVADFNVGFIYSTAQLITELSNPGLWIYPIPNRLIYKINHIPVPTLREYTRWGWKKSPSTEDTSASNRVNIQQHYVLGLWNTDDYQAL